MKWRKVLQSVNCASTRIRTKFNLASSYSTSSSPSGNLGVVLSSCVTSAVVAIVASDCGLKDAMIGKVASVVSTIIHPSVNKFSVRIFGTEKAVVKERERCEQHSFLIIHPFSMFRITWDFLMLCVLVVNLVLLPIAITFVDHGDNTNGETGIQWAILSSLTDSVFIADLTLNFRTAYFPSKSSKSAFCILDSTKIAKNYLKTWFLMDFCSSVPFDHIITLVNWMIEDSDSEDGNETQSNGGSGGGGGNAAVAQGLKGLRMLKLAKFLTLLKLLRITRLLKYASQWEEVFNLASVAMRVVNVVGTMLLFAHLNGCIMFLIPRLSDFPPGNWIDNDNIRNATWREQYSWSLFRAMSHMLGMGYGKHPPGNMQDLWLLMLSMLSGATCYALFIGQATNIIQQLNYSRRLFTEKMKQVEQYMYHRKIPPELQVRIHQYYEYKFKGKMFNENDVLNELNDCLRNEVLNYNCRELVGVVPFFKDADPAFVSAVVSKLQFEVYQPGDTVIQEGTLGYKMYFIQTGSVDVIISDGTCVAQLAEGSYFGEICLLAKLRRTATIKAETFCNMYSLDQADFSQVLNEFPQMRETMESVARERLEKLGKQAVDFAHKSDMIEMNNRMISTMKEKLDQLLQYHGIQHHYTATSLLSQAATTPTSMTSQSCSTAAENNNTSLGATNPNTPTNPLTSKTPASSPTSPSSAHQNYPSPGDKDKQQLQQQFFSPGQNSIIEEEELNAASVNSEAAEKLVDVENDPVENYDGNMNEGELSILPNHAPNTSNNINNSNNPSNNNSSSSHKYIKNAKHFLRRKSGGASTGQRSRPESFEQCLAGSLDNFDYESFENCHFHCASCTCYPPKKHPKRRMHYLDNNPVTINLSSNGLSTHDTETAV